MVCHVFLLVLLSSLWYTTLAQGELSIKPKIVGGTAGNDLNDIGVPNFFYPCQCLEDLHCIRSFFYISLQCEPMTFNDSHPVHRDGATAYMPKVNLTLTTNNDVITFSGSKIEALYLDRASQKLVMSVSFKGIRIESHPATYIIHQRGKEPIIASDSFNITYTPQLTAVIPIDEKINIRKATVTAYNFNAHPPFEIGDNLKNNPNPVVRKTIEAVAENVPTVIGEVFLTEAYNFFIAYMQSQVCDFGITITPKNT